MDPCCLGNIEVVALLLEPEGILDQCCLGNIEASVLSLVPEDNVDRCCQGSTEALVLLSLYLLPEASKLDPVLWDAALALVDSAGQDFQDNIVVGAYFLGAEDIVGPCFLDNTVALALS